MKPLEPAMTDTTMAPVGKINPLKTQMTLQQLQKMAEEQRQQVLRNNRELIAKQQRLKEMQAGLKKKPAQGSPKPKQNDAYASKLRETYQNHLGRLREMKLIQDEVDSQKFDNIELAHELDRVRGIFSSKQRELVAAAAKVDNLTKQLEDRRNGLSNARVTPEKLNRRRKIRAARDELDRLRKELTVRNEVNNQQEEQLSMQQSTLKDKRKELSELDKKINLLGNQLKPNQVSDYDSDTSNSSEILGSDINGNNKFGAGYLFDTLKKKKATDQILQNDRSQSHQAVNGFSRTDVPGKLPPNQVPYFRRGKFYVAPDGREFDRPPTLNDYPEFGRGSQSSINSLVLPSPTLVNPSSIEHVTENSHHLPKSRTDVLPSLQLNNNSFLGPRRSSSSSSTGPGSPSYQQKNLKFVPQSPSSSVSSLSSVASTEVDITKADKGPVIPSLVGDGRRGSDAEIWTKPSEFRTSSPIVSDKMTSAIFEDAVISTCSDSFQGATIRYQDAYKSDGTEWMGRKDMVLPNELLPVSSDSPSGVAPQPNEADIDFPPPPPQEQLQKPPVPPKPPVAPKPKLKSAAQPAADSPDSAKTENQKEKEEVDFVQTISHTRQPNFTEFTEDLSKISVHDLVEQFKDKKPVTQQTRNDQNPLSEDSEDVANNAFGVTANGEDQQAFGNDDFGSMGNNDPYEMTFADIDMISATQNDLLPYLNNIINEQQAAQPEDHSRSKVPEIEKPAILPVIISVPLDKMPPTILKKPGRDNKKRGRIQLDPHALLLDAALEGEMSLVKEIVDRVPDPSFANAEGITALHNAVCGNHKEVVRFLVEIGCDINSPDNNGWTPLHCASFYNDVELCRFLVEHGASVYAMTYSDRQTAAEKCSRLEDNYDQCFGYLHDCKEHVGRINSGNVCSLYDYTAEREDELNFHCGEQLRILRRGDTNEKEWWWAENRRKETGYVPYNLLGIHPRIAGEV